MNRRFLFLLLLLLPVCAHGAESRPGKDKTPPALENSGNGAAENNRGRRYEEGKSLPQHYKEARYWYLKAAGMGNLDACVNLGNLYYNGIGVPKDAGNAARWFRKAAEQGHNEAQLQLGKLYASGEGVPKDLVLAHMWLNLSSSGRLEAASKAGDGFSPATVAELEQVDQLESRQASQATADRDAVAKRMTTEQITLAQEMARTWKPRSRSADQKNRFSASDWPHWSQTDGECQTTRDKFLSQYSRTKVRFEADQGCKVTSGDWLDPYTGKRLTSAADTALDHVVPLAYASLHGGDLWPKSMKQKFANDFDNLQITTSETVREKAGNGPAIWKPPAQSYWCEFAYRWRNIVTKYGLSIDRRDDDALLEMTQACD
ncbi:MAG: SEL1-like repeat protein [Magnetococcales bacterium]|nr:SEL1-like repeat protein [Magnetococcales bacterium]